MAFPSQTQALNAVRKVRARQSPQQIADQIVEQYGNKARTRIELLQGTSLVTVLPAEEVVEMLASSPGDVLLIARRTDHGEVRPAFLRAGAIAWIEGL